MRGEEPVGGQFFTACLQDWVHVGHARDCSLPPPSNPSEQLWCPEGSSYGTDPQPPPTQAAQRHPGVCRVSLNPRRVINPLFQVTRLLPSSDQHHLALKAAPLLLGKTAIIKKHQAPEVRNTECLKCFQNSCPSFMPVLATFNHAINTLLVFKWSRSHPHRPQKSIIYGQKGFLPLSRASPGWPSLGIFQENKSAPSTKAVPGGTAFSCPPASSSACSQWPLSRQPQPRWSAILPQLLRNYNAFNLGSGGRGGGACTGEKEQRRKSILSQSHRNKKPGRTRAPANWHGSWVPSLPPRRQLPSRYCFKEGTPAAPSFIHVHKRLRLQALGKGLPHGGRGKREEDEKEKQHNLSQRGQKSSRLIDLMILFRSQHNKANSFLWQFKTSFHRILCHANTSPERKGSIWAGLPADKAAVSFG